MHRTVLHITQVGGYYYAISLACLTDSQLWLSSVSPVTDRRLLKKLCMEYIKGWCYMQDGPKYNQCIY